METIASVTAGARSDALVFFGATGDLAYKKIFPALQALARRGKLDFPVVGVAKSWWTRDQLIARARASVREHGGSGEDKEAFAALVARLRYVDGDYNDASTFAQLRSELKGCARPAHYLAIPPSMFPIVIRRLGRVGLRSATRGSSSRSRSGATWRLPRRSTRSSTVCSPRNRSSGSITTSARKPFRTCCISASPTRFSSRCGTATTSRTCRSRWPSVRREGPREVLRRDGRDPGRHPEPPAPDRELPGHGGAVVDYPEAIRDEQAKVLRTVRPMDAQHIIRGQFRGYRDEPGVAKDSQVATYAALRLHVDSWRWAGVPFYVRAGKSLKDDVTEVFVELKKPPQVVFSEATPVVGNYVRFRLGPQVAIALGARVKRPGEGMTGRPVELSVVEQPAAGIPVITSVCSATRSRETPRCSPGRTLLKQPGRSSIRSCRIPARCSSTSPGHGDQLKPTDSWLTSEAGTPHPETNAVNGHRSACSSPASAIRSPTIVKTKPPMPRM